MSGNENHLISNNYASESAVGSKIGAMFLLIFTAFVGCCIPFIIQHFLQKNKINQKKYNKVQFLMQLANCFAGGAFIGLSLFHLLPEAIEQVASTSLYIPIGKAKFNVSYILIFVGFSIIFLLEKVIADENDMCGHQNKCYESEDVSLSEAKGKNGKKGKELKKGKKRKEKEEKQKECFLSEDVFCKLETVSIDIKDKEMYRNNLNEEKLVCSVNCSILSSDEVEAPRLLHKNMDKQDLGKIREDVLPDLLLHARRSNDAECKYFSGSHSIEKSFCSECCIHDTITADELTISGAAVSSSAGSADCSNVFSPSGLLARDSSPSSSCRQLCGQSHLKSSWSHKGEKVERGKSKALQKINKLVARRKRIIKNIQVFKDRTNRTREAKLNCSHDNCNCSCDGDNDTAIHRNVELCCLNSRNELYSQRENQPVRKSSRSICDKNGHFPKLNCCSLLLHRIQIDFLHLIKSTSFYLFVALFLHSLLEGFVVGTSHTPIDIWLITVVTVGHKWAEGFSLSTNFISKNIKEMHGYFLLLVFILSSPIGILIGIIVIDKAPDSTVAVVLNNLAVGAIFYVATEILTGEFSAAPKLSIKQRCLKYGFFLLGASVVLALTFLHFAVGSHGSCCSSVDRKFANEHATDENHSH